MADRLLELASLEKRRTLDDVCHINLNDLMHDVAAAIEPIARRKNVALLIDAGLTGMAVQVDGNAFLLHRALANLLANAVDFSPPDSRIELAAQVLGRKIRITVRDHGAGIPDYALDRVFEKFYSLPRPDSGRKSTGLGLAFVREVAHLHGGEVQLANHAEGGTLASLTLPALERQK